ncbi:hypothetical protein [Streptomyces sp. NBC_01431]|nr:hypothetical protein [Streptomyces sp. NBC_01431]
MDLTNAGQPAEAGNIESGTSLSALVADALRVYLADAHGHAPQSTEEEA